MGLFSRNAYGRTAAEQQQVDDEFYAENDRYWAAQRAERAAALQRAARAAASDAARSAGNRQGS
jgi:uncharacterized protein YdaU (DUF1376 family)